MRRLGNDGNSGFIDIHTHILPGVDDGSEDLNMSIRMLADAYKRGTRGIFLTPHYKRGYQNSSAEEIREKFSQFKRVAYDHVPLSLYLGTEALYEIDLPQKLMEEEVLTMNNTASVLVEFLPGVHYDYLSNGIFELLSCGFVPIIAHIERYRCLNRDRVSELANMGAKLQINAASILGQNGPFAELFCKMTIRNRLIDFIASDAHDAFNRHADLSRCAMHVKRKYGTETLLELFSENASSFFHLGF